MTDHNFIKIVSLLGIKIINDKNRFIVYDSLDLSYSKDVVLPDNLIIKGNLYLNNLGIKNLPKGLTIEGGIDLFHTNIKILPLDLKVNDFIYLEDNINYNNNSRWIISNNIGSRRTKTVYDKVNNIVHCGCFIGSLIDFETRVKNIHNNNRYFSEYIKFIEKCKIN